MRLIYNCGRLRAKGYATFIGASGNVDAERPGVDQLVQAVQRGQPLPGSAGIVRKLAAEGREIIEVLVLDHGRALERAHAAHLEAALGQLYDRDLLTTLNAANGQNTGHTAAQAMVEAALTAALPTLAKKIPPSARKIVAIQPKPAGRPINKRTAALVGIGATLLLLLGGFFWLRSTMASEPELALAEAPPAKQSGTSAETTDAVLDFLRACHGEPDPAQVDALASAFAELEPTKATDGLRDRPQLLEAAERETLPDLSGLDDKTICANRQALWQAVEAIRPNLGETGTSPYADILTDLGERAQNLTLIKLATIASQVQPPPPAPPDCAANRCFPILHPADVAAIRWIDGAYGTMTESLVDNPASSSDSQTVTLQAHAEALREAEVRFRGELALVGISAEHPAWLQLLWNCEGREHLTTCGFPLAESSAWARPQP
jgi:hypothetical protein